jgi:hypothetical protein
VDTFERFASRAVFSCPLPSMVYTLHYFGKSIALGEGRADSSVIRFALVLAHGLRYHRAGGG